MLKITGINLELLIDTDRQLFQSIRGAQRGLVIPNCHAAANTWLLPNEYNAS